MQEKTFVIRVKNDGESYPITKDDIEFALSQEFWFSSFEVEEKKS